MKKSIIDMTVGSPVLGVNVFRFSIQGMGYSPLAIIAGVLEMIARTFIALAFVPGFGFFAACFASLSSGYWQICS